MVGPGEIARRARGRVTGRLESLPILALSVHSACNCRCVMCDIWKANSEKREISSRRFVAPCRRHSRAAGPARDADRRRAAAASQLVGALQRAAGASHPHHPGDHRAADRTTRRGRGVVRRYRGDLARWSARSSTTRIRRVKGGFDRIAKGVMALRAQAPAPRLIARSVVQRDNARRDRRDRSLPRIAWASTRFRFLPRMCRRRRSTAPSPGPRPHRRDRGPRKRPSQSESRVARSIAPDPSRIVRERVRGRRAAPRSIASCSITARWRAPARFPACSAMRHGYQRSSSPAMC